MLELLPQHRGLIITNPTKTANTEYKSLLQVTAPLVMKIPTQDEDLDDSMEDLSPQRREQSRIDRIFTKPQHSKATASYCTEVAIEGGM